MKKLQKKLWDMKNRKEEANKGFSLVELIIVIAIMAILVGIVGTQVIPYINKSKESKDYQIINSYSTAATTAYSTYAEKITADTTVDVYAASLSGNAKLLADEIKTLTGYATIGDLTGKMQSTKGGTITKIEVTISITTKKITTQAYAGTNKVFDEIIAEL